MSKVKKVFTALVATFSIMALSFPMLAQADNKPIEQFYDQGPSVKNVGGYSGVLVDDTELITNQLSNMVGFNFNEVNGTWTQMKHLYVAPTQIQIVQVHKMFGTTQFWTIANLQLIQTVSPE